jgi:hypothetical protein
MICVAAYLLPHTLQIKQITPSDVAQALLPAATALLRSRRAKPGLIP